MLELKDLSTGFIIRVLMHMMALSAAVALYVTTDHMGKDKNCSKYYISNIVVSVLMTIFIVYIVLYENKLLPE